MDEIGIVKSTSGIFAVVSVEKKSACDQCSAGCKITDGGAEIEAINRARATVGQRVRVALRPSSYLKSSILAYGVPASALIVGAVAGKELFSGFLRSLDPDVVSAIFGFGAFMLSLVFVKVWSTRMEKNIELKPVIDEILEG